MIIESVMLPARPSRSRQPEKMFRKRGGDGVVPGKEAGSMAWQSKWIKPLALLLSGGMVWTVGGKDGTAMLWDLNEGKHLYSLEANAIIHSMVFSPNRYWLCAATDTCIKIWDLESKSIVDELTPDFPPVGKNATVPYCTCICWSPDGQTLFSGYTDGLIRAWHVGGA